MPGLTGPDEISRVASAALEIGGVDGVEVLVMHEWGGLTRFANSSIHQSMASEDTDMRVRVVSKDRVGVAGTNDFTPKGARGAAESAREMALVSSPDPEWPGLAPAQPSAGKEAFDESTASATPEGRASAIADLVGALGSDFHAAGAFETNAAEVAVANTQGQFCYAPYTQASVTTVVSDSGGAAGFAEAFSGRVDDVDAEAIGRRAGAKAQGSRNPASLEPGRYDVVLEPAATSTLVGFLSYMGFGGRMLEEGRSCFSGKKGERVGAEAISMFDDALDPRTLGLPFDFEGTPRQRTELITEGVFVGEAHDRRSAAKAGVDSTGHALPPPNPEGPLPLNVCLAPGETPAEELIRGTERGLLVTRFHYSNIVHPIEGTITGMTRDGTFLIEDGEIAGPVRNMRFTQSIPEALTNTVAVGNTLELASEFFFSASLVPALAIRDFHFTSVSDH